MEQKKVKVSVLQMASILNDIETNILKITQLVEKMLPSDSDILILPEVWSVGWCCDLFKDSAKYEDRIKNYLSNLARQYNINIIAGSYITKKNEEYYNTCNVIDRKGRFIAQYNKMHLYSYYGCNEGLYIKNGNSPTLVEIEGIKYGLTICYDIRFPEIYRQYAKNGADVLVNCAAWGAQKALQWECLTKARAIENQCYFIALTQTGLIQGNEYNLGESRIIDYNGNELKLINGIEGIISETLNINEMYEFRAKSPTIQDIQKSYEVKICKK